MAKATAQGATHYLAEGDPVPADLPEGVRLVGPGAPVAEVAPQDAGPPPEAEAPGEAGQGEAEPGAGKAPGDGETFSFHGDAVMDAPPAPDSTGGRVPADEDGPADYGAYRLADLRDLARERSITMKASAVKADLVDALRQWDADHPYGG